MAFEENNPAWKFNDTEIGDCVKIIDADGNEFRGTVQQVSGKVIWIYCGGLYWRDCGQKVGVCHCASCIVEDWDNCIARIEHATLDELDPLLDIGFLQ